MRLTRRAALGAAAAALVAPATAHASTEGDLLLDLWMREMGARLAYGAMPGELAATLRIHDGRHAAALAVETAAVGLGARKAPTLDQVDAASRRLAKERTTQAAIALEEGLIAAYQRAIPQLREPKLAMTVATILASHAQHELMLRAHP